MKLSALSALLLSGFAMTQGCVDTSPIDYHPLPYDGGSSTLSDAAIFGEGGLVAACRACIGATCAAENAACQTDQKCANVIGCLVDAYCLNYDLTDLAHLKPCLLECSVKHNLLSAEDPVLDLFGPVLGCAQSQCASVCNVR